MSVALRLATYNAHDCIGRDGQYSPSRIAQVIEMLDADLVALQEVTLDHQGDLLATLRGGTGMQVVDGTLAARGIGRYGNLLLSRLPIRDQRLHDLSSLGRETRGAIGASIATSGGLLHVLATHLGLRRQERAGQIARLLEVSTQLSGPLVLMGDLNAWWRADLRPLRYAGMRACARRGFPARWPLLALDQVWVRAPARVLGCRVVNNQLTRLASDHLPLLADVAIEPG